MKKTFLKGVSALLALWLLLSGALAVFAAAPAARDCALSCAAQPDRSALPDETADDPSPCIHRLVYNEKDADGNTIRPYWVDEDGNAVDYNVDDDTVAASALPTQYDTRSYGYVTPIKDQGNSESCWAFSAISCFESSMIQQGYGSLSATDYSEAHLTWFTQRQRVPDSSDPTYGDGINVDNPFAEQSSFADAAATLMRGSGVQSESSARWMRPTTAAAALQNMAQQEEDRYVSYGRLYQSEWISENTVSKAKTKLTENGNLSLAYYHDSDWAGWNEANACYFQNQVSGSTNHIVTIVGWDDSFSKTCFNASMRPTSNGAWLVKGSWGKDIGNNGYYWLSYEDPSISGMFSVIAKPKEIYDNIYQYDGAYPSVTWSNDTVMYAANRFRSTKYESLTHVAFLSYNKQAVSAKVEVYVANDGYTVPSGTDPKKDMTCISEATTAVDHVQTGYYTVQLASAVNVSNKYFTVVVTFTNDSGGKAATALEGQTSQYLPYGSKSGQSFVSKNNTTWYDTTNINGTNYNNVPIKAMTQDVTVYTLHYDANEGTGAPADQTGQTQYVIATDEPKRSGYQFLGWSEDRDATEAAYIGGNTLTLTGDLTLYAVWQQNPVSYTLHYDANFGAEPPADQTGGTHYVISAAQPKRGGYLFLGWSKDRSAAAATYKAGDAITLDGDMTLYAVWAVNPDAGLTVSPASVRFAQGSSTQITCTVSGFEGVHYHVKAYPQENSMLNIHWGEWDGTRTVIQATLYGRAVCEETIRFELSDKDNHLLSAQTVSVTVTPKPSFDGTFTVSANEVSFEVGGSATVTCAYDGFSGHEWIGVDANAKETQDFLTGSWGPWENRARTHTLTASEAGTATLVYTLYDADTEETLATQEVKVTVKEHQKTFLEKLRDFFRTVFSPLIMLWRLIFG